MPSVSHLRRMETGHWHLRPERWSLDAMGLTGPASTTLHPEAEPEVVRDVPQISLNTFQLQVDASRRKGPAEITGQATEAHLDLVSLRVHPPCTLFITSLQTSREIDE